MRQSEKRILSSVLSFLILLSALFIFVYLLKPVYIETQSLRAEVLKRNDFIENQKLLIDQFKNLNQDYENQKNYQEMFNLILPNSPSVAEALLQISGLLNNNNLNLISFNVGKPVLLNKNQTTTNSFIKPIGSFNVNFKITGEYSNFKNFLNQLETNIRLSSIKTININQFVNFDEKNKNPQKTLVYDIDITFYYQSE